MRAKRIILTGIALLLSVGAMGSPAIAGRRECIKHHYYALKKLDAKAGYGFLITTARHLCY